MKAITLILSILILTSCAANQDNTTESLVPQDTDSTLRIALLPTLDNLPLYYAQQEGIFDTLGLDIQLLTYAAAMDADTAFLGTSADIIVTDLVKQQLWTSRGDSLTTIMSTQLNLHLITAHNARIKQLPSIKEKIVGITRHSSVDLIADQIMAKAKLTSLELNKPQINNIRLRCLMVDQNQYDGAILPEPFASECEARGAYRLISTADLHLPNLSTVITRDSIARRYQTQLPRLVTAYNISVERLNRIIADTTLLAPPLMHYLPAEHCVEIPDTLVHYTPFIPATTTPADTAAINLTTNWLKERKLTK